MTWMTVAWSNTKIFKIQNGGLPPCWKILEMPYSPTNEPIGMKLGWSHSITSPTCPPWCGCHGNGRCLACEQLWASGSQTRKPILIKFCTQQQIKSSTTVTWQNIKIFKKFKMADGRYVGKYLKSHNAPTKGPIWTKLGWSHPIMSPTCPHDTVAMATAVANGALNIQQLWASGGQTRGSILMKFSTQQQIRTSTTVFRPNIIFFKFKMAYMLENIGNAITRLPVDRLGRNLGGRIAFHHVPDMSVVMRLSW